MKARKIVYTSLGLFAGVVDAFGLASTVWAIQAQRVDVLPQYALADALLVSATLGVIFGYRHYAAKRERRGWIGYDTRQVKNRFLGRERDESADRGNLN